MSEPIEFELDKHSWRGTYLRSMVLPGDGTLVTLDNSRVTNRWPLSAVVKIVDESRHFTLVLESSWVCGTHANLKFSFRRTLDDKDHLFQALSSAGVPIQQASCGQTVASTGVDQDQTVSADNAFLCIECSPDAEEVMDDNPIGADVGLLKKPSSPSCEAARDDHAEAALDVSVSVCDRDDDATRAHDPAESAIIANKGGTAGSPIGESRTDESPLVESGSADSPATAWFEAALLSPLASRAASPDQEASLDTAPYAEIQPSIEPSIQVPPPVAVEPPTPAKSVTPQPVSGRRLPTPLAVVSGARTPGSVGTVPPSPPTPAIMQAVARMRATCLAPLTVRQLHDNLVTEGGALSKTKLSKVKKASSKLKRQELAAGAARAGTCESIAREEHMDKENVALLDMLSGAAPRWFSTLGLTEG
jgi:hypothetical protein